MGQARGDLYEKAGVSGPTAFGDLPEQDRIFWSAWQEERMERREEESPD